MNILKSKKVVIISALAVTTLTGAAYAMTNDNTPVNDVNKSVASSEKADVSKETTEQPAPSEPDAILTVEQPAVTPTPEVEPAQTPSAEPVKTNPYAGPSPLYFVYEKRQSVGKTVGMWGGASSWVSQARALGLSVDRNPQVGDIYALSTTVYYVEAVNADSITVSTYFNGVVTREMSSAEYSVGWFIH